MRFGHKFGKARYRCPECDTTLDIAVMEQDHHAICWCPCGAVFAVSQDQRHKMLGYPFGGDQVKDTPDQARLRKEIATWVASTGLDEVREVLAHEAKVELDDLGSLDTLDIARYGFTGTFEMDSEEVVEELAEWSGNDPEEWEEDRENWEDHIHRLHAPKR